MLVYRVERLEGYGPYHYGAYELIHQRSGFDTWSSQSPHPGPEYDGLDHNRFNHVFGFKSREQLKKWFEPHARQYLAKKKYKVGIYSVPSKHVQRGGKQITFNKQCAKLVKHIGIRSC